MLFADAVFNIFAGVFTFSMMFAQKVAVVLFTVSVFDFSKPRCYYSCPYAIMRKLDAIIRVRMLLCESSMLLFVFVCCYAKPRCYYLRWPTRDKLQTKKKRCKQKRNAANKKETLQTKKGTLQIKKVRCK